MAGERAHEFELIERYLAPLATDPGSVGLVDDAAVLTPAGGEDLVLTKDALAADIHFFAVDRGRIGHCVLRLLFHHTLQPPTKFIQRHEHRVERFDRRFQAIHLNRLCRVVHLSRNGRIDRLAKRLILGKTRRQPRPCFCKRLLFLGFGIQFRAILSGQFFPQHASRFR